MERFRVITGCANGRKNNTTILPESCLEETEKWNSAS